MNQITRHVWRFLILLLLQVLVFQQLSLAGFGFNYIQIFIYPLFIVLLPIDVGKSWMLVMGFLLGTSVDMFYDSPGLHAAAMVMTSFVRPFLLKGMEPRGGYKMNTSPTPYELGTNWFYRYASILLTIHLFTYFTLEAFQLSSIFVVILKTISSFLASMVMIILYVLIFNPKK